MRPKADQFARYLDRVEQIRRADPQQREGQAYYNAAHLTWPGLLADLPAHLDPFSLDRNLPGFLDWLENRDPAG